MLGSLWRPVPGPAPLALGCPPLPPSAPAGQASRWGQQACVGSGQGRCFAIQMGYANPAFLVAKQAHGFRAERVLEIISARASILWLEMPAKAMDILL